MRGSALVLSRVLGLLAVAFAVTIVWVGWWALAVSSALAWLAFRVAPRPFRVPARKRRRWVQAIERRIRPVSWRPRPG